MKMEPFAKGGVYILDEGNDMSGNRWGIEGPPEEAYSRITNPERFQPLHDAAMELLIRLEQDFDVKREDGYGLDEELERNFNLARPVIRITPHDSQAAPIVVVFTESPGLYFKFGSWRTEPLPHCGCDACDETADGLIEEMNRMVEAVVFGGFREATQVPLRGGDGWQESEFLFSDGHKSSQGRVSRSYALEMTGGKLNVTLDWKPWTRRQAAAPP